MVKHVNAAELRIVFAAVLAAASDAVLIAHHLQELSARLYTALAYLHVYIFKRGSSLEAGRTREKKGGETQEIPCGCLARETGNAVVRARISRSREPSAFTTPTFRAVGAV